MPKANSSDYSDWRKISAKKDSKCSECGSGISIGDQIWWSRSGKSVKCFNHIDESKAKSPTQPKALIEGKAGASAKAEFERRSKATEEKRLKAHPKIGKLLNLYYGDTTSTKAWDKGSRGEILAAKMIEKVATENGFIVLHDRAIPGSKANIDHILITPTTVFVIDAKNYEGLVRIVDKGNFFTLNEVLYVGSRPQTKLVEGVKKQVALVSTALEKAGVHIEVKGMLSFQYADWPLISPPTEIDGVLINGKGTEKSVMKEITKKKGDSMESAFKVISQTFKSK